MVERILDVVCGKGVIPLAFIFIALTGLTLSSYAHMGKLFILSEWNPRQSDTAFSSLRELAEKHQDSLGWFAM